MVIWFVHRLSFAQMNALTRKIKADGRILWHVLLTHADLARFPCSMCLLKRNGLSPTLTIPALGFVEGYALPSSIEIISGLSDVMQVEPADPMQAAA